MLQAVAEAALELTGARVASCGHGDVTGQFSIGGSARAPGAPACPEGKTFLNEKGGVHMELLTAPMFRLSLAAGEAALAWLGVIQPHAASRSGARWDARTGRCHRRSGGRVHGHERRDRTYPYHPRRRRGVSLIRHAGWKAARCLHTAPRRSHERGSAGEVPERPGGQARPSALRASAGGPSRGVGAPSWRWSTASGRTTGACPRGSSSGARASRRPPRERSPRRPVAARAWSSSQAMRCTPGTVGRSWRSSGT
jgi:hypothetical protein